MWSAILIRWSGSLALLGSVAWTATWMLVLGADDLQDIFGLSERGWRTLLLNPAMLCFMLGLAGFHTRQRGRLGNVGKSGSAICQLGLGTMLVGNIVEFWVSEPLYGTQEPGWMMMGIGLVLLPIGLLLFGIGTLRANVFSGWRRAIPLALGSVLAFLLLAGATMILLSGPRQKEFVAIVIWTIGAGWAALGYALWSENREGASRRDRGEL